MQAAHGEQVMDMVGLQVPAGHSATLWGVHANPLGHGTQVHGCHWTCPSAHVQFVALSSIRTSIIDAKPRVFIQVCRLALMACECRN